ncbi:MAG: ATP-binding protein [Roseateles sp.]|uniref:ATP-binding protein n=1 Tax=Roseateles sp. TaxID=1971397 RepID=UPI0040361A1D
MKPLGSWLPAGLARRFSLAAAGLAAVGLLLTSLASWWLINHQHEQALHELNARARDYRAAAVGSDLKAMAGRMSEIAGSTILATGLVDSVGRETYLVPYLGGVRQINGMPVQVLFTDFEGQEIASNGRVQFSPEQRAWLAAQLHTGTPGARVFDGAQGAELVAMEPMVYARTASPEGAVLYKVQIKDLNLGSGMQLRWGSGPDDVPTTALSVPPVFEPLGLRLAGEFSEVGQAQLLPPPVLHIVVITLALFAVVAVAGVRLSTVLTRQLQQLEGFARRLEGAGLTAERAPVSGDDEVASVAAALNRMLDTLNAQQDALLSEREKLTRLTGALQDADRRKDEFLAMLAHELRNPLAPITTGAELLSRLSASDSQLQRISGVISRQAGHMTKIVADLLDVSRVTRGLVTLEKVEVDLEDVVHAAVEQVRPLVEQRQHALDLQLPGEPVVVLGDRARLVQVVSNLLSNAAKYTPEGGQVQVRLQADAREALLEVQDNGIGIAPELMSEVFDLFTQGSRTADRAQGGLGLGLALVKHLVELHGGSVAAASEGSGMGTSLSVRLPRLLSPAWLPAAPVPAGAVPPLALLVVDDNIDAARTLADFLALEGHVVRVAHDGTTALDLAAQAPADAYVLDVGLPGMTGYELARRLRESPHGQNALLIALTGYGQPADRERSRDAGFDHHLVKPADAAQVQALLAQASPRRRPPVPGR